MPTLEIKAASVADTRRVLRLTLATAGQSAAELERQVTGFIRYARKMSLDLSRQWVCMAGDRMVSACMCIESPGRTAMLLLPQGDVCRVDAETISNLVLHVMGRESPRDVRLLQCLLKPDDSRNLTTLLRLGFRDIAILSYMAWTAPADGAPPGPAPPAGLQDLAVDWITYDDAHHGEFARLISATYRDSLDCPSLGGLRDIEDVIVGHKSAGRFRPHRWLLLRCQDEPAGCILLVENPVGSSLELVYMGVHPDWRRKGVGKSLLFHGLSLARREHFETVTLAVDTANAPALALYTSAGFGETTRRRAMIRPLDSSSSRP